MAFFGLLVLAGIALLLWWFLRGRGDHSGDRAQDDAFESARRRYAAGEITHEQYDDIVRTLGGRPPGA